MNKSNFTLAEIYADNAAESITQQLNLSEYKKYIEDINASNFKPYHNYYHSMCMVKNCYDGALAEELSINDRKSLVVAALFHDFNHSAGHFDDATNIQIAVSALVMSQTSLNRLDNSLLINAMNCIKITQYPYVNFPSNKLEEIIRDADLMQSYETDDEQLKKQFLGLKQEMQVKKGKISVKQFADEMNDWLTENVHWHSAWAKEKAQQLNWESELKPRLIRILESYESSD